MKSEENTTTNIDIFSPVLLTVTILTILLRAIVGFDGDIDFSLLILAAMSVIASFIYFYKVRQLPVSTSTPISDALVTLGGVYLGVVLLLWGINIQQVSIYGSMILIGIGVFGRIILLDRVLITFLTSFKSVFSSLYKWVTKSWIRLLRLVLLLGAITILFVPVLYGEERLAAFNGLLSLFFLIGMLEREYPSPILRFIAVGALLFLPIIAISQDSALGILSTMFLAASIFLWLIGYDTLKDLIGRLMAVIPRFLRWISDLFRDIYNFVKRHPVGSAQAFLLSMALVSYAFIPSNSSVMDIQTRLIVALSLAFLGILPTLNSFVREFVPPIWRVIKSFANWVFGFLTNWGSYPVLVSIGGSIALIILPTEPLEITIGLAIITSFSIALVSESYLMRFYDRFYSGMYRLVQAILPSINLGSFISFLSYVAIVIYLFPGLILPSTLQPYRFLFLLGGIILWNVAYPHRRDRFVRFLNWITGGLFRRLSGFVSWFLRNVLIIGLTILGFVFFIGGFGLVFSDSIPIVTDIFGEVTEDRLISLIIGIFLFFIGGYTIQQAQARKLDLQRNVGGQMK